MEKRKKANPNCLQLSLGSKHNAVNLILNGHEKNFQISFSPKDGKKNKMLCPGQRQIWIPPPGKTTRGKRRSCCLYNEIMLSLPEDGKFVLPHGSPVIIESQHLENFKAALYPPRSDSTSVYSCDSFEDQSKRIRQSYEKQCMVAKESEKLLKEHNSRRKMLLKHITLLKRNLEEINKSIQEMESDVTEAQLCSIRSSFDDKKIKSYTLLTEAKILEHLMKRKEKRKGKEKFKSNIPSNLSAERAMMNLADNMRKSKLLLDSTLQEEEAINELQTKYIQGVEELYEGQQRLLKRIFQALDNTSSSDEDRNVDDIASGSCGVDQELQLCHKIEKLKLKVNSLPNLANYLQNQNLAEKLTLDKLKEVLESIEMKSGENRGQLDMNKRQMISSGQKQSEKNILETKLTHKTETISHTLENENNVPGSFPAENLSSLHSTQEAMEKLKETLEKLILVMPKESQMSPVIVSHHEESISVKPINIRERENKRDEKMDEDGSNTQAGSSNDEVQQSDENAPHRRTVPEAESEDGSTEVKVKVMHKGSSGVEMERIDELPENETDEDNRLIIARRNQAQHQDQISSTPSDQAEVMRGQRGNQNGRPQSVQLDSSTFKPKNESTRLSLASRRARILPKQQSIRYRRKVTATGRPDVSEEFFPNLGHDRLSELNETEASSSLSDTTSSKLLDVGFIDATPAHLEDRFSDAKNRIRDHEDKLVPGTSPAIAYKEHLNDRNTRIDSNNRFSEYIPERDDRVPASKYISNDTEEKSECLTSVKQRITPPEQMSRDDNKPKLGHTSSNREKYRENTSSKSSTIDSNDRLISGFISNTSQYEAPSPDNEISNSNDELVSGYLRDSEGEAPSDISLVQDENDRQITSENRENSPLTEQVKEATLGVRSHAPLPYGAPLRTVDDFEMMRGNESEEWHVPDLYHGSLDSTKSSEQWHVPDSYHVSLDSTKSSEQWHVPDSYHGSLDSSSREPEYVGNSTSSPRRSKVNRGVDINDSPGSERWYRLDSYHGSSLSPSDLEGEVFYNEVPETHRQNYAENGMTRQPEVCRVTQFRGPSNQDPLNSTYDSQKLRYQSIPVNYDRYGKGVRPGYDRMCQNGLRDYPQRRVTYHTAGISNTKPKFYDLHQFPAIRKDPNIRSKSVATPLYSSAKYNELIPRRHTVDWNKIQQKKIRNLYNEIMR